MQRKHHLLIVAGMACAILAGIARAQTYDWINTSGGTYSTAANWSPAGPPPAGGTARFALANTYNVTFSASATVNILTMTQGDVTLFLNGFTYQPTNTVNNGMGSTGLTSSLRITNGTFLPGNFIVGGNTGSTSHLILDAGSATTVGAGVFYIGTSGTGNLSVRTGATLSTSSNTGLGLNASGVGTATVTGAGSTWNVGSILRVGSSGNGALNVLNGGVVTANALEVGENFNSVGVLSLNGANATFTTNGTANIGGSSALFPASSATLNIGPGATMNLNGTTNLRTSATVNMTGGTLNLNTLNVTPGAAVNWSAGKMNFANASSITGPVLDLLLAGTHALGTNRTLSAAGGTMNLDTALAVNGGTINVPNLDVNAPLSIGAFGKVTAGDSVTLGAGQSVQIENFGTLGATNVIVNNGGTLELKGGQATVTGFVANNFGVVQGTGRFAGGLNNGTGGTIRARAGDHLIIDQIGPTNPGRIELSGGTIEYTKALSNLANGFISGRGEFRGGTSNPGSYGLSNLGVVAFSGGTTDVYGDVQNSGAGLIIASGGGTVTFYDDVTHNGAEIRTNAGSRTVFFGGLTGAGPFTGTGVVEINGDLKPGNSPGILAFGGDVELGSSAAFAIEIGGTTPGAQYDRIDVAGRLSLGGTLNVSLLGGFMPTLGDSFDVMNWGALSDTFAHINLPSLVGPMDWDVSNLYTTGTLNVVPEPATLTPMVLAWVCLLSGNRRRRLPR